MKLAACAAVALVVTLAGCGDESSRSAPEISPSPSGGARSGPLTGPPPLTLQRPEGEVELPAYAWCYVEVGVGGCADGPSPAHPPLTTATDPVTFTFPLEGWSFTASFRRPGPPAECERVIQVEATDEGDGTYVVPALVPAGRWEVQVSGSADAGGSLATAFAWTTSVDAPALPDARGAVGLLGPPDVHADGKELEASGPSLTLTGLGVEPSEASAELVLSGAGDAGATTYPLSVSAKDPCPHDGAMSLSGSDPNEALDLSGLGDPPYSYEVTLTLDGTDHTGTGQWPDDLSPATSNQLALTWSPPLPAWNGSTMTRRHG